MHYYKKNLGDYYKKAGRLSIMQHGVYTLLIDACYDREEFPTSDQAMDWCWASSKEEIEAVEFVLRKFFTLENGVYIQARIESEIAAYQEKSETNKRIAKEREAKRRVAREAEKSTNKGNKITKRAEDDTKRAQEQHDSPPNQEPVTNNQLTTNQEPILKEVQEPATNVAPMKTPVKKKDPAKSTPTWAAYSQAYKDRYGVYPTRSQKISSILCKLVDEVGQEDAPGIAATYIQSNSQFYLIRGHPVDLLLADAQKLRTEYLTGKQVTQTQARQLDRKQNNLNVADEVIAQLGREGRL